MQDYGGPVGFRLALAHPERVKAMVIQNAVASEAGLGPAWDARKAFWQDRAAHEQTIIPNFLSLATTKARHLGSSPNPERYDPNSWADEFAHLSQPGQRHIQADLFYDYRTNVAAYPAWQAWMRRHQPPMLVVWGQVGSFLRRWRRACLSARRARGGSAHPGGRAFCARREGRRDRGIDAHVPRQAESRQLTRERRASMHDVRTHVAGPTCGLLTPLGAQAQGSGSGQPDHGGRARAGRRIEENGNEAVPKRRR